MLLLVALAAIPAMGQSKSNRDFERAKAEVERSKQEVQRELARAKAEMARAKAEIERAKSEFNRSTYSATVTYPSFESQKERDRQRKIQEAMRRGVVVMPMRTYPDDYINPGSTTDRSLPEELQATPWDQRLNCVKLKPEQLVVSKFNLSNTAITAIENKGNETYVTYSKPCYYHKHWYVFNRYTVMVDRATGDRYFPRRVLGNIPFDRILIVEGCKGRTLDFTVVYPKLAEGVERIVLRDDRPVQTEVPLNRAAKKDYEVNNVQELLQKAKEQKKGRDIY